MSEPKETVGVRIPKSWVAKLEHMAEETNLSKTDLLVEAIGRYLGEDVSGVSDRLQKLEREVNEIKKKFLNLATL